MLRPHRRRPLFESLEYRRLLRTTSGTILEAEIPIKEIPSKWSVEC